MTIVMVALMCLLAHGPWRTADVSTASAMAVVVQGRESGDPARTARLAGLRERARARIEQERSVFSQSELADIETRYLSAHQSHLPLLRRPEGPAILTDLIQRYPRSNRAGCATLELARIASGTVRERYLRTAIANYGDAWFETGVQVGAVARAMLAVHLAGLDRFDEAEAIALELVTKFPGSIDDSGAALDDLLASLKLLKSTSLKKETRDKGEGTLSLFLLTTAK